ncbi:MBOAT family O-acyltransferase [Hymenobacter perfusus]|uniref:MBOAT family protein n=1 Tax=Hymenobacter perfusus TaxID=1236770 RepID=A0A428JZF5_9BACT|nr:MBOAT family O-acyltransferase [Hymenobacter perfusus]RSK39560.1 MBOAT family protein [Hymenobacter perfusus]
MLYNSLQFLVFFIVVTILYFQLPWRGRWMLLLGASCFFYMAFVPEYILILGFTIVIDYFAGLQIERARGFHRKLWLISSLAANISILAVFKYFNFFVSNANAALAFAGMPTSLPFLNMLLPIGLSFHTFQAMSYTIEVYRGSYPAERHFGIYSLYVMFYPQLVAGPIERPQNVLPQFHEQYKFDWELCKSGLLQMAFGLFKKVVIADRLARVVDGAYNDVGTQNSTTLLIATIFYAFQIYCDFSGYSDIGIGAARVMGFDLMKNFDQPYTARSIGEFWRRWHISLSTWFRDYLYIPLGGNRVKYSRRLFNVLLVFLISGLWHGASWAFIIWGGLHGLYQIVAQLWNRTFPPREAWEKTWIKKTWDVLSTFALVTFAWIFFRAHGAHDAVLVIKKLFIQTAYQAPDLALNVGETLLCVVLIGLLLWKERYYMTLPTAQTWKFATLFSVLLFSCYLLGVFDHSQFIYFQF